MVAVGEPIFHLQTPSISSQEIRVTSDVNDYTADAPLPPSSAPGLQLTGTLLFACSIALKLVL